MSAPNRLDAVEIVARRVLIDAASEADWADYPEIGEWDWESVMQRVDELASDDAPTVEEYEQAYDVLAALADKAIS